MLFSVLCWANTLKVWMLCVIFRPVTFIFFIFRCHVNCISEWYATADVNQCKTSKSVKYIRNLILYMLNSCRRCVFCIRLDDRTMYRQLTVQSVVKFSQSFKHFIIKRPQGSSFFFPIHRHKKCSLNRSVKITLSMNSGPAAIHSLCLPAMQASI
jgi:hypothetical protein